MADELFLSTDLADGVLHARVLEQKVAEREATIIEGGIAATAGDAGWKVALDVSPVMLLASVGLGMLINLHGTAKSNGGKLVIHGMSDQLLAMLKITKLHKVLTIVKDRDAAIAALR